MPRNPMQDIVPKGTRSIRKVPLPETRQRPAAKKPIAEPREEAVVEPVAEERPTRLPDLDMPKRAEEKEIDERAEKLRSVRHEFESHRSSRQSRAKSLRGLMWGGIVIVVLVLAFFVSNLFHSATLTLTPRTAEADIADDLTAKKSGSGLVYQPVPLKEAGSLAVKATGEENVVKKATGTVVIYNNYNASSQRLIKNTRFETPEGLIFRITDSVTVPGKKGTTPGSVEATVVADEAGEKYNVGLKDFTIPGFKGDPRYTAFYARSKTPLAGGFVGTRKIVSDTDRKKAEAAIEAEVTASLLKKAVAAVPADKVFFGKAYSITFATLPEESSGSEVTIKKEGTLTMALFDRAALSSSLAGLRIKSYGGEPILATNLDSLTFTPKGDFKPESSDSIAFNLAGKAHFEWVYDELALKAALKGLSRADIPSALQGFPMIEKADISIRPFWSRSFPDSVDDIMVKKAE